MRQISFTLMAFLCAVGMATAQVSAPRGGAEPDLANSTAVVSIDSTGEIGGDFTNGFFPNARLDVVWIDEPQHGTVQYGSEMQLVAYQPSAENLDQIDKFTVYATDDGTSWNITRFFFDPETGELTFSTDLSNSPYEGASLKGDGQAAYCSTFGILPRDGWTRFWGGVKLVGGALETAGGVVIGVGTSWTGVGAVAGGGIAVHGADNVQAGIRQLWSGEEVRTFTSQGVSGTAHHVFGVEEEKAVVIGEFVDAGIGLAGGLGTVSKAPQIVDKFGDAFVLSAKTRATLAGGGYLDDTIDLSGDIADIIKVGGTISGSTYGGRSVDELNQLFSKIPDEFGNVPRGTGDILRGVRDIPWGQYCRNGCEEIAKRIKEVIGGQIYRIRPRAGLPNNANLGARSGNPTGWFHHDVVVKDGRVYDALTGPDGVMIDEFKKLWDYADDIDFGF